MLPNVNAVWTLVKETWQEWNGDKAPRLAAALSYSTIFSIAPLFIIIIAIVGNVLGFTGGAHPHTRAEDALIGPIRSAVGADGATMVRSMIDASFNKPRAGLLASIVGWIAFAVGASGVFAALQDSLNTVWDVEPKKRPIWVLLRERILSVSMLLVIGFLLLVTFAINAALAFAGAHVQAALPFPAAGALFAAINWLVSLAVITLLFALIYKYLPDADVQWRDVWSGALLTAVFFVIGQALIGIYLGRAGVASAYGAAGSLLALLVWIYYSALLLLFGAEFTKVYARSRGARIRERGQDAETAPSAA